MEYCPGRKQLGDTVEAMVEGLIKRYCEKVKPGDSVYFLGDVMFGRHKESPDNMQKVFCRLPGQKFLIRGNHDHYTKEEWFSKHFVWIRDYYELGISEGKEKKRVILCHYPMLVWNGAHHENFMLHGHSHGGVDVPNRETLRLDVGVDAEHSNYYPLSYEQIKEIMSKKAYKPFDHHGTRDL